VPTNRRTHQKKKTYPNPRLDFLSPPSPTEVNPANPAPSQETKTEAKTEEGEDDLTFLAVIGILDEIKGQSNLEWWIRARRRGRGMGLVFLVGCGREYGGTTLLLRRWI